MFNYLVTKDYVASGQRQIKKVNCFMMYDIYILLQCELVYRMPKQILDVICEHEPIVINSYLRHGNNK